MESTMTHKQIVQLQFMLGLLITTIFWGGLKFHQSTIRLEELDRQILRLHQQREKNMILLIELKEQQARMLKSFDDAAKDRLKHSK